MQYVISHAHALAVYALSVILGAIGFRAAWRRPDRLGTPVLCAFGIFVAQASQFWGFTVDDAFIAFRFARNWAEGLGPVYQAGDRVEGFTSFAWTALLALAHRLGADIESVARVAGLLAGASCLPAAARAIRQAEPASRAAGFAPLLLALDPLFVSWAGAGMEAPLFAAVLAWATVALLAAPRGFPWDAVLFGCLVWIRPEGMLFAGVAVVLRVLRSDRGNRAAWLAILAVIVLPFWIGRWAYYGSPLPNTFVAKTGFGTSRLLVGWHSVADFAGQQGVFAGLAIVIALAAGAWRKREAAFVPVSIAAFLAYAVWAGGDVLHLRFYVHVLPLWTAMVAVGFGRMLDAPQGRAESPAVGWGLAAALGLIFATVTYQATERARRAQDQFGPDYVPANGGNIQRSDAPLGRWLRDHAPPGSRVAAEDIGALGYESRLTIVDLHGLTDRRIARLFHRNASAEEFCEELRSRDVDFMVLYGNSHGPGLGRLSACADWIERDYRLHSAWRDSDLDKGKVLLVKRGVEIAEPPAAARVAGEGIDGGP